MATKITNHLTDITLICTRRMSGWYEITNTDGDSVGCIRKYDDNGESWIGSKPWFLFTEGDRDDLLERFHTLKEAKQRLLGKYVRAMSRIEQETAMNKKVVDHLDSEGERVTTIYGVYPDSVAASIDPSMGFQLVPYGDNYHIVSNTGYTFGALILDRRPEQYGDTYKVILGGAVVGTACDPGLAARRVKAVVSDIPATMDNALDTEFVDSLTAKDSSEDVSEDSSEDSSEDVSEGNQINLIPFGYSVDDDGQESPHRAVIIQKTGHVFGAIVYEPCKDFGVYHVVLGGMSVANADNLDQAKQVIIDQVASAPDVVDGDLDVDFVRGFIKEVSFANHTPFVNPLDGKPIKHTYNRTHRLSYDGNLSVDPETKDVVLSGVRISQKTSYLVIASVNDQQSLDVYGYPTDRELVRELGIVAEYASVDRKTKLWTFRVPWDYVKHGFCIAEICKTDIYMTLDFDRVIRDIGEN